MEVKISICTCGFAVDVDQKFSIIAGNERLKKGVVGRWTHVQW